jgi:DNA-binding NarL/FixJ family response regulator
MRGPDTDETVRAISRQLGRDLAALIEGHVQHILGKLGFHSRSQIAVWVTENRELLGSEQVRQ